MNLACLALAGLLVASLPARAAAHEYWIAPERFVVAPGEKVAARLFVGQMMEGNELPWLSRQIDTFRYYAPGETQAEGREGDRPALTYTAETPGLHVIAQETLPLLLTFDTLAEFEEYLAYEGLAAVVDEHRRRGLPDADFAEAYTRSAKALVQVGPPDPADGDRRLGLAHELTALVNPYAGPHGGFEVVPVQLDWQGMPAADVQVSVFRSLGGEVERSLLTTDAAGRVEVPVTAGAVYLLNAVHVEPVEGADHVWASSWASLTFAVPPRTD